MARLTKNSYKRKIILFGLLVFMSIALISTGFAAWVMSTNATNDDANGNVSVGVVKDASLTISNVVISSTEKSFRFEPLASDESGRVRYDDEEGLYENLSITVTGQVAPIEYLGELKYELVIPESVKKAADAGYIVLPDSASYQYQDGEGNTVKVGNGTVLAVTGTEGTFNFTFTIDFKWGAKFGNMNPGLYYDTDAAGMLISDTECKKELQDFRALLYGYDAEMTAAGSDEAARDTVAENHKNDAGPVFTVLITAKSN